jgi:hypothetical protein
VALQYNNFGLSTVSPFCDNIFAYETKEHVRHRSTWQSAASRLLNLIPEHGVTKCSMKSTLIFCSMTTFFNRCKTRVSYVTNKLHFALYSNCRTRREHLRLHMTIFRCKNYSPASKNCASEESTSTWSRISLGTLIIRNDKFFSSPRHWTLKLLSWRRLSTGTLRRVDWHKLTDVSEVFTAPITKLNHPETW